MEVVALVTSAIVHMGTKEIIVTYVSLRSCALKILAAWDYAFNVHSCLLSSMSKWRALYSSQLVSLCSSIWWCMDPMVSLDYKWDILEHFSGALWTEPNKTADYHTLTFWKIIKRLEVYWCPREHCNCMSLFAKSHNLMYIILYCTIGHMMVQLNSHAVYSNAHQHAIFATTQ